MAFHGTIKRGNLEGRVLPWKSIDGRLQETLTFKRRRGRGLSSGSVIETLGKLKCGGILVITSSDWVGMESQTTRGKFRCYRGDWDNLNNAE